jgi:hypothetical protein
MAKLAAWTCTAVAATLAARRAIEHRRALLSHAAQRAGPLPARQPPPGMDARFEHCLADDTIHIGPQFLLMASIVAAVRWQLAPEQ